MIPLIPTSLGHFTFAPGIVSRPSSIISWWLVQAGIDAEGQQWLARGTTCWDRMATGISSRLGSVCQSPVRREPARAAVCLSRSWRQLATRKINGFTSVTKVNRIPHFHEENVSYASEVLTLPATENRLMAREMHHVVWTVKLSSFVLCTVSKFQLLVCCFFI